MQFEINDIARAVNDSLKREGLHVPLGHVFQLLAAAFGYSSLASMQTSSEESSSFANASHVVLDAQGLKNRVTALKHNFGTTFDLQKVISSAVSLIDYPPIVSWNVEDLLEEHCEDVQEVVLNDETIASEAAMTNADWGDVEVFVAEEYEPLCRHASEWVLPVTGTLHMVQHEDRMSFGDEIEFSATLRFEKTGRVCLRNLRIEIVEAALNS
jgi:hypothetical protein